MTRPYGVTPMFGLSRTHLLAALSAALIGMVTPVSAENLDPKDWSAWEKYRGQVQHPAAAIKAVDLARARENVQRYDWARNYATGVATGADGIVEQVSEEYLEQMLERTTPGCVGPCPACRAKDLPWHPNGQWSWSANAPEQLTCSVCKTVFPNAEFPEEIVLQSTWDPEQKIGFVGGETFKCFGYTYARPSISSMIRARKVGHVLGLLHRLGIAYALTEKPQYARTAKTILLRFAEVLPKYLVRAGYGYGEYADCDPHTASERIGDLPNDELVYPPNKPDRSIYTGYWSASRLGSSGMDGGAVSRMAQAYDLTCMATEDGAPVYSDEEKILIERDVLLEASYLAACDTSINNKSVGNRAGAAMVGMVVGHPGLVRFGLDGFKRTVDEWFLPDGGTSESPAYAMMTMGGVRDFGLMLRDYSDPEGFTDPDGNRLEQFDACRDTRYGDCWQGLLWTLQGDLRFPPSADSYRTTAIDAGSAELLAVAYPTDEHIAFLKERAGASLSGGSPEQGVFYREPGLGDREVPRFSLPDVVFPHLAQGYLRTGDDGRASLAMLNASDYGGHHHLDSLNLYYWKDGRELLSDLGYLWDHPDSYQTRRTMAHNVAMVGLQDQLSRGRRGSFHLFSVTPRVKAMEASSRAYAEASTYRRTCVQIEHADGDSYLLDIFRTAGGANHHYVFHGPNNDWETEGLQLGPQSLDESPAPFALRIQLPQVSEVYVDDVEVRQVLPDGTLGENLAPNASLDTSDEGKMPPGWGIYVGDGTADSAVVAPGREGGRCVRFRALKRHENGRMNAALLVGDSNGYVGRDAIPGMLGATYKARFWIKGDAEQVNFNVVTWPNAPGSSGDRTYTGSGRPPATDEWALFETTFTLPSERLPMDNARQADGAGAWHATWQVDDAYTFTAFAPGTEGETVFLADGWGQRDHRNSDRGATLPYIVRSAPGPGPNAFVSVFAGQTTEGAFVTGVRLLELADAPDGAVVAEVTTSAGTDVIVSMPEPQTLRVDTALGSLETDGRVAAVLGVDGKPVAASLIGGTQLAVAGTELSCARSEYSGTVVGVAGAPGESYFAIEGELPEACIGHTLLVTDGDFERAYIIRDVTVQDGETRVYAKRGNVGVEAVAGETWRFVPSASWERQTP